MKNKTNKFIIILLIILLVILLSFGACFRFKKVSASSTVNNSNIGDIYTPMFPICYAGFLYATTPAMQFRGVNLLTYFNETSYYYHNDIGNNTGLHSEIFIEPNNGVYPVTYTFFYDAYNNAPQTNNSKLFLVCSPFYIRVNKSVDTNYFNIRCVDNSTDLAWSCGFAYHISGDENAYHLNRSGYVTSTTTDIYNNLFDGIADDTVIYITSMEFAIDGVITSLVPSPTIYIDVPSINTTEFNGLDYLDKVYVYSEFDLFDGIVNSVNDILEIEILPDLSFYDILIIAIAIPLLIMILRIWLGG